MYRCLWCGTDPHQHNLPEIRHNDEHSIKGLKRGWNWNCLYAALALAEGAKSIYHRTARPIRYMSWRTFFPPITPICIANSLAALANRDFCSARGPCLGTTKAVLSISFKPGPLLRPYPSVSRFYLSFMFVTCQNKCIGYWICTLPDPCHLGHPAFAWRSLARHVNFQVRPGDNPTAISTIPAPPTSWWFTTGIFLDSIGKPQ